MVGAAQLVADSRTIPRWVREAAIIAVLGGQAVLLVSRLHRVELRMCRLELAVTHTPDVDCGFALNTEHGTAAAAGLVPTLGVK